jgi:phosphatidate cytidylyltransferase
VKTRVVTAVVAAALFLPIVFYGGLPVVLLSYLLASVGLYELLKMRKMTFFSLSGLLSVLLLWVILLPSQYSNILDDINYSKTELGIVIILLLLTYTVVTKNSFTFDDAAFSILAAAYVGIGFYFFVETRDKGIVYIFYSLFMIWATDSGAYFIGKSMGKTKLWPDISPNKTVEGSIGGILCAMLIAALFVFLTNIKASLWSLLGVTFILSAFGQLGDLVESALKRHFNVKDSGTILPGHGGILDRFDSLLFVWPLLHFFHII